MYKVEFEHSNSYEETLSLFGGGLALLDVWQTKIMDCLFDRQNSLLAGGAIAFLNQFEFDPS